MLELAAYYIVANVVCTVLGITLLLRFTPAHVRPYLKYKMQKDLESRPRYSILFSLTLGWVILCGSFVGFWLTHRVRKLPPTEPDPFTCGEFESPKRPNDL